MGYIMNLRKFVGHETLIGIGATTLVFTIYKIFASIASLYKKVN